MYVTDMPDAAFSLDHIHREREVIDPSTYNTWEHAPDWIVGYNIDITTPEDAFELARHLRAWLGKIMPGAMAWLWVPIAHMENISLLAGKVGFSVEQAPLAIEGEIGLLQCIPNWGVRDYRNALRKPLEWVQEEIERFCIAYPRDPASEDFLEMLRSPHRDSYVQYHPERLDVIARYANRVDRSDSQFFALQGGAWNPHAWGTIWSWIRDHQRSLSFWENVPITASDLAPGAEAGEEAITYWYNLWWDELASPPRTLWSPWAFFRPAAIATLQLNGRYYCARPPHWCR